MKELEEAFGIYFEEIARCVRENCYWALVHVLVVLPEVCAALETDSGEGGDYKQWCKRFFDQNKRLTPSDRYALRCALVHQGRTVVDEYGQYGSYSFVSPTLPGETFHLTVRDFGPDHRPNCALDISQMAEEMVQAMRRWFADLAEPGNTRLANVRKNIRWLARRGQAVIPNASGVIMRAPSMGSTGGIGSA